MPSNRWQKMPVEMDISRILIMVVFMLALSGAAGALEVIQGDGPSYPIIETSQSEKLMEQIKQQAAQKPQAQQPLVRSVQLKNYPQPATEDRLRSVDISFVLPFDLKDKDGNVLFEKGQRYNPLKDMSMPMTSMIVVDGEDQKQLEWAVEKQQEVKRAMVLICRGDSLSVLMQTGMRVYHLNDSLMEKFKIERVPCIVMQKQDVLQVVEYSMR
jgi:hypothetical protein